MSRFLIAATHKSSGKTVVSTGLAAALTARGLQVQPFKKGPDYIDPMWLRAASGQPCYNLDFNTMGQDELLALFASRSLGGDISMIEANKGLFDGVDVQGRDSNAQLAKILNTPVILVVDTSGMTRGIAPLLQGYQAFDPHIKIAGVILNKTGGSRHEGKLRAAIEAYCDVPVLGAIGKTNELDIGERHLGLTTPAETGALETMIMRFGSIIGQGVDLDRVIGIAGQAAPLPALAGPSHNPTSNKIRIGIARDTAFGFYYPDDLEAFAAAGAELVPINMLTDQALPQIDGLFIGGGFPETQMHALTANQPLRAAIKGAIENGLPTYAECGGLMYLSRSLSWQGETTEMVGVIPGDAVMYPRPQGRGYTEFTSNEIHPWGGSAHQTAAHEFHYARIENLPVGMEFARNISRGTGVDGAHDGIIIQNLLAGFCHLRHTATNPWVTEFVKFVRSCSNN